MKGKRVTDSTGEFVTTVSGLAWSGIYIDRSLGWVAPCFVSDAGPETLSPEQRQVLKKGQRKYYPSDFYRVRVTIVPLKDKNGKFIVKRNTNK